LAVPRGNTDNIIRQACIIHQTDYWRRGRTLDKLGIGRLSVDEVMRYVMERSFRPVQT